VPAPSEPATLTITARIKPRSRLSGIEIDGAAVVIRVASPPIEGRANAEAIAIVAAAFGVPKSRVELVAGERSRSKRFRIVAPERTPPGFVP